MKALWEEFGQLLGELVRLGEGGTPLQRLVASGVAGLMAQVEYGLRHYPGDPAAVRMQRLLEVLKKEVTSGVGTADKEALSGVWGAADKETWSGVWGAAGAEVSAGLVMSREGVKAAAEGSGGGGNGDWQKLKAKWSETKEWKEWVGQVVPEAAGESLPQVLWLVTHRVAAEVAERWQRQWRELAGELREHPQVLIAGPRTALLLPPIDKTDAPVVRMDPGAALDQRLPLRLGDHPLLQGMARACSAALWFIENDPLLHYAWHPINRFGLRPFDDDSRNRYIEALITCFAALQEAVERNEIRNVVIKWLELDEGINSLMYDPVPHPDSL
ncbi:MAG: hypothetical protein NZ703_03960, partial [Gemmataceae bacterium]|nr:hypothetical protein [Gemmataceae bacterium]